MSASATRRSFWPLAVVLLALGVAATLLIERQEASRRTDDAETLDARSNLPDGTRALKLWLDDLGYRTSALEYRPFRLSADEQVLFILAPTLSLTDEHREEVLGWVSRGGTLVVVPGSDNGWLGAFGIDVVSSSTRLGHARPLQPMSGPPLGLVPIDTTNQFRLVDPAWIPLLGSPDQADWFVAASRAFGRGRVYAVASGLPLSNAGLRDPASAVFALQLLSGIPPGSSVLFDEYHHGATEYGTFQARLVREPWGWALLYGAGLCLAYLALSGRRFGPALPEQPRGARRARAEYVTTLAAMLRAGDHRDWLRRQYRAQVRHALGRHFRVSLDLPTSEFVAALAAQRPEASALARPLQRLDEPLDDASLIAIIREIETIRLRLLGLSPAWRVRRPAASDQRVTPATPEPDLIGARRGEEAP